MGREKSNAENGMEIVKANKKNFLRSLENGGRFGKWVLLEGVCESLDAVGATNIYGALKVALEQAGATGGDEWSAPEIATIFFLSDGRATVGLSTDADETLAFVREQNATAGIVIHTIGLSSEHDVYLMRSLAEQNDGKYVAP